MILFSVTGNGSKLLKANTDDWRVIFWCSLYRSQYLYSTSPTLLYTSWNRGQWPGSSCSYYRHHLNSRKEGRKEGWLWRALRIACWVLLRQIPLWSPAPSKLTRTVHINILHSITWSIRYKWPVPIPWYYVPYHWGSEQVLLLKDVKIRCLVL
jgi:hypothetical protein